MAPTAARRAKLVQRTYSQGLPGNPDACHPRRGSAWNKTTRETGGNARSVFALSVQPAAAMSRGAAVEFAKYGIRVNCFGPGSTLTNMVSGQAIERFPTYTAPKLLIKRMATPEEQAAVACFLASDDASYMTGEIVYNCGGWGLS